MPNAEVKEELSSGDAGTRGGAKKVGRELKVEKEMIDRVAPESRNGEMLRPNIEQGAVGILELMDEKDVLPVTTAIRN